jgi:hypothetical protein
MLLALVGICVPIMLFVKPIWLAMTAGGHSHEKDSHAEAVANVDDNYSAVDATK